MRNDYKNLTAGELLAKKDEVSKKYFELRFQKVIGHVENPLELRTLRRNIARLNTRIANGGQR